MLAVWTTQDRITFWTAIATICVFLVYAYIAWETRRMAKASIKSAEESRKSADAAIKSAEVSAKAFEEGQKYQEQAAKHQELTSFLNLFNLLLSHHLSEEKGDVFMKTLKVLATNDHWFEGAHANNAARSKPVFMYGNLTEEEVLLILSCYEYFESMSLVVFSCFPFLSEEAQNAVIDIYSNQVVPLFPYYRKYELEIFRDTVGVSNSNFSWLYDKAFKRTSQTLG